MGEYAKYLGERIKIGTCESMYYLRADQRHLIHGYDFSGDWACYRFPFPDEDDIEPGQFQDFNRGVRIPGWSFPVGQSGHSSVQFHADAGYLLSIPCPEQFSGPGFDATVTLEDGGTLKVGRNGFRGSLVVKQQREIEGRLVLVVSCGACGASWRLETLEEAQPIIDAFRVEAERKEYQPPEFEYANGRAHRDFLNAMADRIEAGYVLDGAIA